MKRIGQPFKRVGKSGWWIRWTDPSTRRRRSESFHTKELAEYYRGILYHRLNSHIFVGCIKIQFTKAREEYLKRFEVQGLRRSSRVEAELTLRHFEEFLCGNPFVSMLTQDHIDGFVRYRLDQKKSNFTINKDLNNLKAFIRWCIEKRYAHKDLLKFQKLKVQKTPFHCPDDGTINQLFLRCPSRAWVCRLAIHLTTGLRSWDVDNLKRSDIDLKRSTIDCVARKTGKGMVGHPLPQSLISVLTGYLLATPQDQTDLFTDKNVRKTWEDVVSVNGITRHDLRRIFSTYMQKIGSLDSARSLLQHSDQRITEEFYTDSEMILRWKVEKLPLKKWMEGVEI